MESSKFADLLAKFETLVNRFEQAQNGSAVATEAQPAQQSKLLKAFDAEVLPKVKIFEDAASELGGEVIATIVNYSCS